MNLFFIKQNLLSFWSSLTLQLRYNCRPGNRINSKNNVLFFSKLKNGYVCQNLNLMFPRFYFLPPKMSTEFVMFPS